MVRHRQTNASHWWIALMTSTAKSVSVLTTTKIIGPVIATELKAAHTVISNPLQMEHNLSPLFPTKNDPVFPELFWQSSLKK